MNSIPVRKVALPPTSFKAADERLLEFAEQQIEKMQRAARLDGVNGQPGFYELNAAMMDHQTVSLGLIALNAMAKVEAQKAKDAFDEWFAEKYVEVRNDVNPRSVASTKWYSTKEIEMEVRVRYRDDYQKLSDEMNYADHKVALIRRILESWQAQQFVLARISKNVEAEITGIKMFGDRGE